MTDRVPRSDETESTDGELPAGDDPRECIESYETEDGVVFYDSANPLAWLKATTTLSLKEQA